MKRIAALTLALILLVCCCACGSQKVTLKILDTEYVTEDYAICIAKENTELLDAVNGALDTLMSAGTVQQVIDYYISGEGELPAFQQNVAADAQTLTMATNAAFPPYEYYENDTVVGIDAVIAGLIADQLGKKLVIDDMEFGSIINAVTGGKADMGMAGMTVTDERLQSVNFSTSYATGIQVIIVRDDSPIASVDDLYADGADYQIGVQQSTTGDIYATDDFGDDHVQRYNKGADAVAALVSGKIDCVIIDNEPAKAYVAANNG